MRSRFLGFGALVMTGLLLAAAPHGRSSAEPNDGATAPVPKYVGVKGCNSCHKSKATGNQMDAWKASAHARAYETLKSEAARTIAKQAGLTGRPEEEARCLACHTTGAGELKSHFGDDFDIAQGVQCESCHGPGSEYSKIEHMLKHDKAVAAGLRAPDSKLCLKCHNAESPTFKGFDYATAVKQIRHPLAAF
jgi:hypothetical protein